MSNCLCTNKFDLRSVCNPQDYRKLKKIEGHDGVSRLHDFRKCPVRMLYCMDFITNNYDYYKQIEAGETEKKRISIMKRIVVTIYKLSNDDFKVILEEYINEYDNLITNKKPNENTDSENEVETDEGRCNLTAYYELQYNNFKQNTKDRIRLYNQKYRKVNKVEIDARKPKLKVARAKYYQDNKYTLQEKCAEWRGLNVDKIKTYRDSDVSKQYQQKYRLKRRFKKIVLTQLLLKTQTIM